MKTKKLTTCGYGIAMLCFCLVGSPTYAVFATNELVLWQDNKQKQLTQLTGTVRDRVGVLAGVIVHVGNTHSVTDINGKYTIVASIGQKITFSMMGYKQQTVAYAGGSELNIILVEDNSVLDEIVVNAGYYTVKERESTGSIARITAKDIEFQPITNPLQAMQGRMAGVNITQNSGVTGGGFDIEIRGQNFMGSKVTGRNAPFYIIDGVPFISTPLGQNNGNLSSNIFNSNISPLNAINPSDIESIEVLKDADATAIYGSRGANGVVLITTKKGYQTKTNFIASSSIGFSKVPKYLSMLNTEQYLKMRDEAYINANISYQPNDFDINGAWDRNRYTNWQKELIGDTATIQEFSMGARGGNEFSNFNINYTHNENTTVFPTDKGYKRNSFLMSYNYKSKNRRLNVNSSTVYSNQNNNLPTSDLTQQALTLAPNAPALYNKDGSLNWQNSTWLNPISELQSYYENKTTTTVLNANLAYELAENFFAKINFGYTTNAFEERKITPHTIYNPAANFTSERSESYLSNQNNNTFIIEPQVNYVYSWGKNTINTLVGFSYQQSDNEAIQLRGKNFTSNIFIKNIGAAKEKLIISTGKNQYKYASLFARLNYSNSSKYFINLTARRDGSSRFGDDYKFGNFGAIGAAWLFSKEDLLKELNWLSFGKIRASYGITGSDNIGDYAYLDTYSVQTNTYNDEMALSPTALYNPKFKWEKTKKFEIATELSFFNDRLNTTIAYYNNQSSDQLVGMTLPTTTGFSSITANSPAVVENKGWEISMYGQNIKTPDFSWTTSLNLSFPKNKLVSYPGLEEGTQSSFYVIGYPINIVKLYKYEGLDPVSGNFTFYDYNKDGKITSADKQHIASLAPKIIGGLQNTLTYQNFSLDFLFYFIKKDNYNINMYYNSPGAAMLNLPSIMNDYHSNSNPNATYMPAIYNNPNNSLQTIFKESTATITDASYIRLKNVSLAYNLKIPTLKLESLKLYIEGQNLWTITSYKGMDPEFASFGYLPPLRTISFGAQLTF